MGRKMCLQAAGRGATLPQACQTELPISVPDGCECLSRATGWGGVSVAVQFQSRKPWCLRKGKRCLFAHLHAALPPILNICQKPHLGFGGLGVRGVWRRLLLR